jgi:MFS family permease
MTYRAKVETLYLLGFSLDLVNMFIGTVAYPAIAADLQASVPQLAWIGNAYMLGLTLVIPLGSWLAARLGERRVLCLSLALFTVGAVLAGTAPSIEWLIAWRLLQGLGGGLLIPVGQAMAYRECPPADRARLTARIMAVALLVPALSPTLGGLLVEWGSWRGVLLVSVPLAVVALVLAAWWVRPGRPALVPALDRRGLLLGSAGLSVLLVALSLVAEADQRMLGAALLAVAGLVLACYARSARRTDIPRCGWRCWSICWCLAPSSAHNWWRRCCCIGRATARRPSVASCSRGRSPRPARSPPHGTGCHGSGHARC